VKLVAGPVGLTLPRRWILGSFSLERFSKQLIYCLTKPQLSDVRLRTGVPR
jgi:hypothetical protein